MRTLEVLEVRGKERCPHACLGLREAAADCRYPSPVLCIVGGAWGARSALVHKVTPAADDQVAIVVDWVLA